jgi:MYXO-CTERM domain-containing protein
VQGLAFVPATAAACPAREKYETDPAEVGVDTVAPAAPEVQVLSVIRAGPRFPEGICHLGTIALNVSSTDDRTSPDKLGYVVNVVGGGSPHLATLDLDGPYPLYDGKVYVGLLEGNSAYHEALEVTLAVSVVDLAGNRSAPTNVIVSDGGGCSCSSTGASQMVWLPVALAVFAARRRRQAFREPRPSARALVSS